MARRREVIGPDGTVHRSVAAAARAAGVRRKTLEVWLGSGRHGWRRGRLVVERMTADEHARHLLATRETGALVSPTRILDRPPLDPSDGRYWI